MKYTKIFLEDIFPKLPKAKEKTSLTTICPNLQKSFLHHKSTDHFIVNCMIMYAKIKLSQKA